MLFGVILLCLVCLLHCTVDILETVNPSHLAIRSHIGETSGKLYTRKVIQWQRDQGSKGTMGSKALLLVDSRKDSGF